MNALLQSIDRAIDENRLPPACFIGCGDPDFAEETALHCAARFCATDSLETYPDFFDMQAPVAINELRELLSELAKRCFCEGNRCVLIRSADLLSEQAQNLLLKTLEEPPSNTLFLLCGSYASMLPTVQSRCAMLRLGEATASQIAQMLTRHAVNAEDAARYARYAQSFAQALQLATQEQARSFRNASLDAFVTLLNASPPYSLLKKLCGERKAANELLLYWLSFTRDLLGRRFSLPLQNDDFESRLSVYTARFTSEQINCMIEMLTTALSRLQTNVSPTAVLDSLMTQMLEEIQK